MDAKNGAASNAVPVVANGRVFVASYKELRAFGRGGSPACGKKIASNAEQALVARNALGVAMPPEGQFGEFKGVIVESSGDILRLKTRGVTLQVDLRKVVESGRLGNFDPGKPVTVRGTGGPNGSIVADSFILAIETTSRRPRWAQYWHRRRLTRSEKWWRSYFSGISGLGNDARFVSPLFFSFFVVPCRPAKRSVGTFHSARRRRPRGGGSLKEAGDASIDPPSATFQCQGGSRISMTMP
jgi:hypothetical protein